MGLCHNLFITAFVDEARIFEGDPVAMVQCGAPVHTLSLAIPTNSAPIIISNPPGVAPLNVILKQIGMPKAKDGNTPINKPAD